MSEISKSEISNPISDDLIDAMHKALSAPDFYGSGITRDYVVKEIGVVLDGTIRGGPGMFIHEWLKKAGVLR